MFYLAVKTKNNKFLIMDHVSDMEDILWTF